MTVDATWRESYARRAAFERVRRAEADYGRKLRKVAQHINDLLHEFVPTGLDLPVDLVHLQSLLQRYADLLDPWARAVATRFVSEVSRRDDVAWQKYAKQFSRALEQEIRTAPTGEMLRRFLETQVELIKSLPLEAAQRVHDIAIGNIYGGARYGEMIEHIRETGNVTRSRATLIARTETARVSSALTMVRAQHIGSDSYIWRTVRDNVVRPAHQHMEGKVVKFDDPPEVEPGKFYHAGMIYNCRCFMEPIIGDRYLPNRAA